jgi:predicted GNAT family acetyltransferase
MIEVTITRQDHGGAGEYRAEVAGSEHIGRLTWVEHGDVRIATHTLVPPPISGRGVAAKLVEAMIEDARERGFRIDPVCSYVDAAFRQHPEWGMLRA